MTRVLRSLGFGNVGSMNSGTYSQNNPRPQNPKRVEASTMTSESKIPGFTAPEPQGSGASATALVVTGLKDSFHKLGDPIVESSILGYYVGPPKGTCILRTPQNN